MHFLMEFIEGLRISWDAIRANKMRSILTGLGIVIGIVTVTLMGTAIEGLNRSFLNSISSIGADVLYVQRSSWMNRTWEDWMKSRNNPPISDAQVKAVQRLMTQSRAVAPHVETRRPIRYKDQRSDGVSIVGSTEALLLTLGLTVEQGRFLSAPEVEGGRPVCVIGAGVATNLFKLEPAVGGRVRVDQFGFEVVGVLKKQGGMFGDAGVDNAVIIPVELFTSLFSRYPDYQIQVKALDIAQLDEVREELRGILRRSRRLDPGESDDFSIDQQEMFLDAFREVSTRIAAVGLFITGLSLFVGGIGIMNIMFVSVAERTREIGVRKAIGAKRRAILMQFLSEAAGICLLGGAVGLAIAYPVTLVMKKYMGGAMSLKVVSVALLVCLVTGVLSGFFPAWRAARMNPVDALRNE
jgi:putative ABC transport system permease protein